MASAKDKKILQKEVDKCNRLLSKLWSEDARADVMRRRRSLLRIIHDIPQAAILPLDWQP